MTALEKQAILTQKKELLKQLNDQHLAKLNEFFSQGHSFFDLQKPENAAQIRPIVENINALKKEIPQLESEVTTEAKTSLNPDDLSLFNKKQKIDRLENKPNLTEDEKFKLEGLKADVGYTESGRKQQQDIQNFAGDYENKRQAQLANQRKQIADFINQETGIADTRRKSLAESLSSSNADIERHYGDLLAQQGQESFKQANPYILEDLNRRGLFTSPSEVANSQARALKEITLQNQSELGNLSNQLATDTRNRLQGFDTNIYGTLEGLRRSGLERELTGQDLSAEQAFNLGESGLNARFAGEQDALNANLNAHRDLLNRQLDLADQDREERMANYLARRNRRANLTNTLINAGTNILTARYGR